MNLLFRILLTIYAFCLMIISLIACSITIRPGIFTGISSYLTESVLPNNTAKLIMFFITLIFLVLSIMFLFSGVKRDKDKKAVSKYTNIGEIKISLNSVENIALTASRKLTGIKESKAYVTKIEDALNIVIKVVILTDINIPSLSEDIQIKVKNSVEETTGIKVNDVKVVVDNIYTGYKSRVE
jgi:uncharacterized alkaline shock family protein YloU